MLCGTVEGCVGLGCTLLCRMMEGCIELWWGIQHHRGLCSPGLSWASPGESGATHGVSGAGPGVSRASPGESGATRGVSGASSAGYTCKPPSQIGEEMPTNQQNKSANPFLTKKLATDHTAPGYVDWVAEHKKKHHAVHSEHTNRKLHPHQHRAASPTERFHQWGTKNPRGPQRHVYGGNENTSWCQSAQGT